jgi:hypothetical protein
MTARREISRQEFLKIGGRAVAGAAVGSTLLATVSATPAEGRETVLITDFGAKGNGVADDTGAILRAITNRYNAGGGVVRIPATDKFYKTTRAIDLKSDMLHPVRIVGEGNRSFIKNVSTSGGHDFAPAFRVGRLVASAGTNRYAGSGQTWHRIDDAPLGQDFIRVRSGTFRRGDMLLIQGAMYQHGPNQKRPLYPQITEVESVEGSRVNLTDPLLDDQWGASVANYQYGVSNGSLENLRFEHLVYDGFGGIAGGAAHKMQFRNLNMTRGTSLFSTNGISRCVIEDCQAVVAKKGVELAYFTHSTNVRRIKIRALPNENNLSMALILTEASHRCVVENFDADVRGHAVNESLARAWGLAGCLGGTRKNVIRRSRFLTDGAKFGFSIFGRHNNKPGSQNRIQDSVIMARRSVAAMRIDSGGPGAGGHHIAYNRLEGGQDSVVLSGATTATTVANNIVPQGINNQGTNNTIKNNTATDTLYTGPR